jgi:hypothetical protein
MNIDLFLKLVEGQRYENVAHLRTTNQSDNISNSWMALDGDLSTFSSTNQTLNPWWKVDFGRSVLVTSVRLTLLIISTPLQPQDVIVKLDHGTCEQLTVIPLNVVQKVSSCRNYGYNYFSKSLTIQLLGNITDRSLRLAEVNVQAG